jgi:hypothetical protein
MQFLQRARRTILGRLTKHCAPLYLATLYTESNSSPLNLLCKCKIRGEVYVCHYIVERLRGYLKIGGRDEGKVHRPAS